MSLEHLLQTPSIASPYGKPKLTMMLPDPTVYSPPSRNGISSQGFLSSNQYQSSLQTTNSFSLPPIRELLKDSAPHNQRQSQLLQPQPFTASYTSSSSASSSVSPDISRSNSYQSIYSHQPTSTQQGRVSPTVLPSPNNLLQHTPQHNQSILQQQQLQQQQHSISLPPSTSSSPVLSDDGKDRSSGTRKKRQNLPRQTTLILLSWLSEHLDRPYPNSREKYELLMKTRLTIQQLDNWFINARRRKINILRKLKENDQSIALTF